MYLKQKLALFLCILALVALTQDADAQTYSQSREVRSGLFGFLAGPTDVDVTPDGTAYIVDSSNTRLLAIDPFGNLVSEFTTAGNFFPQNIAADGSGNVYYVSNFFDRVLKFSTSTGLLMQWGSSGSGNGQFKAPSGVAVAPDGSVYVVDTDNNRVQKFNANGQFIKTWGTQGFGEPDNVACNQFGQFCDPLFQFPKDVAVDGNGLVYVVDTGNHRIQVLFFDAKAPFLIAGGSQGTGPAQFDGPEGIKIGPDGNIYISDTLNMRVQKFAPDGTFLGQFGNNVLLSPRGLSVDRGGNVYVADSFDDRVRVFTPDVVRLDNGASSKNVSRPAGVGVLVDLLPDSYWLGAPAEIYAWVEAPSLKAYYQGTNAWVLFSNFADMAPLFSGVPVPPLNDFAAQLVDSTAGLPAVTFKLVVCLDRGLDGRYNPADSVCDSMNISLN